MIVIDHVSKHYGKQTAVDDLSFEVKPGVVTGFLGPNGAGKSTTMRMIVGLTGRRPGRSPSTGGAMPTCRRRCTRSVRCWRPRPCTRDGRPAIICSPSP